MLCRSAGNVFLLRVSSSLIQLCLVRRLSWVCDVCINCLTVCYVLRTARVSPARSLVRRRAVRRGMGRVQRRGRRGRR